MKKRIVEALLMLAFIAALIGAATKKEPESIEEQVPEPKMGGGVYIQSYQQLRKKRPQ